MNLSTPVPPTISGPVATLVEWRSSGASNSVTSDITNDLIVAGQACLYGSLTCPNVNPGLYFWKIVWGGSYIWTSTLIEVLDEEDAKAASIRVGFRNSKTLHGIRYPWIDDAFSCALRIRAIYVPTSPVTEGSAYREGTTGITRNYNTAADRILKFQTSYLDDELLYGIEVMLLHDDITINGRSVTTREHISFTPGRGQLMPGQFTVIDNSFATPLMLS